MLDDTDNPITKEYLLPIIVDQLLQEKRATVKVLQTTDRWFGVTYPEDKEVVEKAMKELIDNQVYPEQLWK